MMTSDGRWFHPRGSLAADEFETVVDDARAGLRHAGLRVLELVPGMEVALRGGAEERIVIPLAGSCTVTHGGADGTATTVLAGRASVFDGPTDTLYLSAGTTATVAGTGRLAVASSPTTDVRPIQHLSAADTPVELRGAGPSSRQVHNFGTPGTLDAVRLIVCEVITPAGNWSSYPPHKHDTRVEGHESRLEEIYYFEAAVAREAAGAVETADPFGLFAVHTSPAGAIDMRERVRSGDVALVPRGYHGPAVAAPGYDLYYLNVMAGPDPERVWLTSDDPAHAWVRSTWPGLEIDPRLPFTTSSDAEEQQ